jgi:acetyltransferase-like isoleucine patch superfamily enzyme
MNPLNRIAPGTILELESEPEGPLLIDGPGCRIQLGKNVTFEARIRVFGEASNTTIEIGDDCTIGGVFRIVGGDGGVIRIGAGTTFNQVGLSLHERASIVVGKDCMFSTDIHMDPSDMHPIFDGTSGERINPAQDIHIGEHVWLGTRVLVLKGASIGSGTVVGAGSMVSGTLPSNVLAIGQPAKVVRENVMWGRDLDQAPERLAVKAAI